MVEGRGRVATKGTAIAGAESVVASSRGSRGGSNPGIAFRQRGKSKRTKLRVARAARSYLLALARTRTPGWPGVLPWIRRSRLDIDKWLAEGEPNTTLLLHMQGHPFVRTWVRGKREDSDGGGGRENEMRGRDQRLSTTVVGNCPLATTSLAAFRLLCYSHVIMPHSNYIFIR